MIRWGGWLPRLSTLDRYQLREIGAPFAAGLGLFFAVVSCGQILKVADSVTGLGVQGRDLLAALAFGMPPLLGVLIPVSCLFACLLAVGRLAADRELLALQAAGCAPARLLRVPAGVGLGMGLLAAVAMSWGEPWGIRGLRQLMARGAQDALARGLRPGEFTEWLPGVVLYAQRRDGEVLQQVLFADRRDRTRPLLAVARQGRLHRGERPQDLLFTMHDGTFVLQGPSTGPSGGSGAPGGASTEVEVDRVVQFVDSTQRLDVGALVVNKARNMTGAQELSVGELRQRARLPGLSLDERGQLIVTLHRKFAVPLAALIFSLLAVPLAVRTGSAARAQGFLLSLSIVVGYYYLGRAAELASRQGRLSPVLAAWLPDLLGGLLLLPCLWRLRRVRR
jgi:lipopolysaccharide export LptBFGC system permease protein LptF